MEAILKFLEKIGSFFENILTFIEMMVSGVLWLAEELPGYSLEVQTMISHVPPFLQVFVFGSWTIIVLFAVFKLL